jgi:hypothetical protein
MNLEIRDITVDTMAIPASELEMVILACPHTVPLQQETNAELKKHTKQELIDSQLIAAPVVYLSKDENRYVPKTSTLYVVKMLFAPLKDTVGSDGT